MDPDPAFDFDVDPDPEFHSDADPDPASQNDVDPESASQNDGSSFLKRCGSMRIRIRYTGRIPTCQVPGQEATSGAGGSSPRHRYHLLNKKSSDLP